MKDSNSEGNETIALSRPFHYWPIKLVNLAKKVPNRNAIMLYFCSKDDLHFFPPQSVNNDIAYLKTNIQPIEAQLGYIQSFTSLFQYYILFFYFRHARFMSKYKNNWRSLQIYRNTHKLYKIICDRVNQSTSRRRAFLSKWREQLCAM